MTTATAAPSGDRTIVAGVEQSAGSLMDSARRAFGNYRAYRRTLAELNALTDRQLGDAGMTRASLTGAARRAVYGDEA